MPSNNSSETQDEQRARELEEARERATHNLMRQPDGRAYIHELLKRCHVFTSSFSSDPYITAFAEGQRAIGLQILAEVMAWSPDQYLSMMREANNKDIADAARRASTDDDDGDDLSPGRLVSVPTPVNAGNADDFREWLSGNPAAHGLTR
jgi:hypothetical protein